MSDGTPDQAKLNLMYTIAFQGNIRNSLVFHPDKKHILYAVGPTVILKDVVSGEEDRLYGHSNNVTCVSIAKGGFYLASGQTNYQGYNADVIIWDFSSRTKCFSYASHKEHVEAVAFSCDSKYVVSIGGEACRRVDVYSIDTQRPTCSSWASPYACGHANLLCCANTRNDIFITTGKETVRVWKIDFKRKKVSATNCIMGKIRREINCIDVDRDDSFLYCGTTTGDILKFQLIFSDGDISVYDAKLLCCLTRKIQKNILGDISLFSSGVTALKILKTGELVIGTGDGVVCRANQVQVLIKGPSLKPEGKSPKSKKSKPKTEMRLKESARTLILGYITSLAVRGEGQQIFAGTNKSEIYRISLAEFACERFFASHSQKVNDIAFPYNCSDIFVTCSYESIRVWHLRTAQELLRIEVPRMTCNSVFVMRDGRSILSGWNDGKIRAHTPETGKPLYIIEDCHYSGVTAIAATTDCMRVITGGAEGNVRVWNVSVTVQNLVQTMKEHRGAVTSICMKSDNTECVTSGVDGFCIVWSLATFQRVQAVLMNAFIEAVCYGPGEYQIITAGSNRTVNWYEVVEGTPIRCIAASESGAINAMDTTDDAKTFVTGSSDKLVKVWSYEKGMVTHVGVGHSDIIVAIRISHDGKQIVSASKDGSVICWSVS